MPVLAIPRRTPPSYARGYARSIGGSAYPDLWIDLFGAWVPSLGPTGILLRDYGSQQNHGTLTLMDPSTDWIVTGSQRVPGYALDFDGTNDYVNLGMLGNLGTLYNQGTITVVTWIRTAATTTKVLMGTVSDGSTLNIQHSINQNSSGADSAGCLFTYIRFSNSANELLGHVDVNTGITDGDWHQVVYIMNYQASTLAFYVDGTQYTTTYVLQETPAGAANFQYPLTLGAYNIRGAPAQHFPGSIGPTYLYTRALLDGEIRQLHTDPLALFRLPPRIWAVGAAAGITLTPDPVAVAMVVPDPVLAFGAISLAPDPAVVPVSVPQPTLSFGAISMTPDPVTVPLVIPGPTLTVGGVTLSPNAVAIPVVIPEPTLAFGAMTLAPDAAVVMLNVPDPTILLGAITLTPDATAIPIVIPEPAIGLGALSISPDALAIPVIVPSPTIDTGIRTLEPDSIVIPLVIPSPTIARDQAITPSPVAVALVIPTPTISVEAGAEEVQRPTGGWLRKEEIEFLRRMNQPIREARLIVPSEMEPEVLQQLVSRAVQADLIPIPQRLKTTPGLFPEPSDAVQQIDISRILDQIQLRREQQEVMQFAILILLLDEL